MDYHNKKSRVSEAGMLIHKPVETVFEAFLDPNITSNFWFSKSSVRLDKNKEVLWTWEMYNYTGSSNCRIYYSMRKNYHIMGKL